ncbi:MAG TPA: type II toxin-antitoxin system prevent-host-death family antitoxin [Chloroflexota bacterium]|jgi:prevent-host-death family protein|nr:type II toxin-antitoxin system prevent-host-death family antitoxin [Chloroflexota bacterium]
MRVVGVRDLKLRTSEIVRRVREEHESVEVSYRGRVVARIVPVVDGSADDAWADLEALRAEIAAKWPPGVSAVDAVSDVRREL